jgi:hypothetical protein
VLEPQAPAGNPEKEVPAVTLAVTGLVYQAPVGEEATCGGGRATEATVGSVASYWKQELPSLTVLPALSMHVPVTVAVLESAPE